MPSFTDIYASLIENPDIQPPEGQDRDAYVVDLAKQRLRQYKNNEKALSLGMQKSAVTNFADFILEKSEKTQRMYSQLMNNETLTPEKIQETLDNFEESNPDLKAVEHGNLEELVEDDDDTRSAYVALRRLQYMLAPPEGKDENGKPLEPHVKAKSGGGFEINRGVRSQAIGGNVIDNILPPNHPLARRTANKESKDKLKAGKDFEKVKQAYITQEEDSRPLTRSEQKLLDEYADEIDSGLLDDILNDDEQEQQIKAAQEGATGDVSEEREDDKFADDLDRENKANRTKVEALQQKLAEDAREAAEKEAKSEDASKQWDSFQGKVRTALKNSFGKRNEFKELDWKNLSMDDPRINNMIDYLGAEAGEGKKAQKATVMAIHDAMRNITNLSDSLDSDHPYHQFFGEEEDSSISKFYQHNPNLTALTAASEGVRRAVIEHFEGDIENISPDSVGKLSDEDLTKIWTEAQTYLTDSAAKSINPEEDIREKKLSFIEDNFPSRIPLNTFRADYEAYQTKQQEVALAKVKEGGEGAEEELKLWYKDDALQSLRDTYDFTDEQLMQLAHRENDRSGGKRGPDGSSSPAYKQIRNNTIQSEAFLNNHKGFLTGDETSSDTISVAMREGMRLNPQDNKRSEIIFEDTAESHDDFNAWRSQAFEQYEKDVKLTGGGDAEEDFWGQVAEKTGLPVSLVRTGSNEDWEGVPGQGTKGHTLSSEMKESIYNAMRSTYKKEMLDRQLPFVASIFPEDAKPIVDYDDLEPLDMSDNNIYNHVSTHFTQTLDLASKVDDSYISRILTQNRDQEERVGEEGPLNPRRTGQGLLNKIKQNQAGVDTKDLRDTVRKEAENYSIQLPGEDSGIDWNSDTSVNAIFTAMGVTDEANEELVAASENKEFTNVDNVGANIPANEEEVVNESEEKVVNESEEVEEKVVNESGDERKDDEQTSGMDNIKNLFADVDYSDERKKNIEEAQNVKELEEAVGRSENPVTINSVPLRGATLFEMMRSGLFDMGGSPTNRGEKFLDLIGERFESVTEMFTDDMQKAFAEKYGNTFKFDKDKYSLSKAALSHMITKWNSLHDEDNQIPWKDTVLNEDGSEITKLNGDPVDEDFFENDFTYGDDAPHFKESIWGEDGEVAGHDVFSRMLLAGIISSRLNGAGEQGTQDAFKEIFDTGGIARPSNEIINNQDEVPKKNDEIISSQELKDSNTNIETPKDNTVDAVGSENQQGQPIELNVNENTGEIKEEPVDPKDATNVDFIETRSAGGTPPPETPPTATEDDDKEDDDSSNEKVGNNVDQGEDNGDDDSSDNIVDESDAIWGRLEKESGKR